MIITRKCSGGCGAPIQYEIEEIDSGHGKEYMPDVSVKSGAKVAFAGGHLCMPCYRVICDALAARIAEDRHA